jgi:acyl-CoA dehydrogenase
VNAPLLDPLETDDPLAAFRADIRAFIAAELPPEVREKVRRGIELSKADSLAWNHKLAAQGWLAPNWPVEWGGTGWSAAERAAFQEEMATHHAPEPVGFPFEMIGPVLIRYGTPAQKHYFLPRMLSLEHGWCQGYSEPNAGSDLASLGTRARRVTDPDGSVHYVVDGSKIWTSYGHRADWIFCLVRTDSEARQQEGISFLLIDLKTPGITMRPIIGIHGWHLFNQVFFDEVKVPVENRVGEENQGWTIAKSLLEHERLNLARVGENRRRLARLRAVAQDVREAGRPLWEQPEFRLRFHDLETRVETLAALVLRFRLRAEQGHTLGPETGMLKLVGSQLIQDLENATVDALGPDTIAYDRAAHFEPIEGDDFRSDYAATASARRFVSRGFTIAGGSSEIQHELLAKQVLGL